MFERFTDRARAIMVQAQVESRALNHSYIGTEHILLSLIHEGEGVAAQALESLGISLEAARQQVEEVIGAGPPAPAPSGHIPFTPRAKKVLELSLREALQLGHNYIGTEHILLGLIREGEGVAAQVLARLGADHDRVRAEVIGVLAARESAAPAGGIQSGPRQRPRSAPVGSIRVPARPMGQILDALEAIGERLAAIEARLGITGQSSRSQADLELDLARLTALLRRHGIDPDAEPAADAGSGSGVNSDVERPADSGSAPGGDPGASPGQPPPPD